MAGARETMVIKALCVLEEAKGQAKYGLVPASFGLRFALAYLYLVGERQGEWFDRQPYDDFWRSATAQDASGGGVDGYGRQISTQANMNAIARAAGFELDVTNTARLGRSMGR